MSFFKEHPHMVKCWTYNPTYGGFLGARFYNNRKNFKKPGKWSLRWAWVRRVIFRCPVACKRLTK